MWLVFFCDALTCPVLSKEAIKLKHKHWRQNHDRFFGFFRDKLLSPFGTIFAVVNQDKEKTEMAPIKVAANIGLPTDFIFGEVLPSPLAPPPPPPPPSLGPLAAFSANFAGNGFNTIFRPDNTVTPTKLPIPVTSDNILELNLSQESLSFSPSLGAVPNRGTNPV